MASNSKQRQDREARDRLRIYEARQQVFAGQRRRRVRDNVIAVLGVLAIAALATVTQIFYFTAGPGAPTPSPSVTADAGTNVGAPDPDLSEYRTWNGELTIGDTVLGIELDGAAAPQAVSGWLQDLEAGYYPGKACHRVAANLSFLQCGSLTGDGSPDPAFRYGPIENAPADELYVAGTIAMARAGNDGNSIGHQFFVVLADVTLPSDSAGGYTVVGRVTSGLEALAGVVLAAGIDPSAVNPDGSGPPLTPLTITALTLR